MKPEQIITVLYDLALTTSGETRVKPLLSKMLQRLLYHTSFPCGFFFSYTNPANLENGDPEIEVLAETTLCSKHLNIQEGQNFKLPRILNDNNSALITDSKLLNDTFPNNNKYKTASAVGKG